MKEYKHQAYRFFSDNPLEEKDLQALTSLLHLDPLPKNQKLLTGRGVIRSGSVPGMGELVVKEYLRGGFWSLINKKYYCCSRKLRPQIEYDALRYAQAVGVKVPEPIAFVVKGNTFYRAWLIMKKLDYVDNLANLSVSNEEYAHKLLPKVAKQIEHLIANNIFHCDLHPGNVLVGEEGQLYLIDFDKAKIYSGSLSTLRDIYLLRWRRAVIKHELPDYLAEYISAALRKCMS